MASLAEYLILIFFSGMLHGPHPFLLNAQNQELIWMGKYGNKEYYITRNRTDDFVRALRYVCPDLYSMELATIESNEEFDVIDEWYRRTYPITNATSPVVKGWTSGIEMGKIPLTWATNNLKADINNHTVVSPGSGPGTGDYYWRECLTVYHRCNRPHQSPEGCWPLETVIAYTDCRETYRIICQKIKPSPTGK